MRLSQNKTQKRTLGFLGAALLCLACSSAEDPISFDEEAKPVIENYARLALANYTESTRSAKQLQKAVDALVAGPSISTLRSARQAWLAARLPYGRTEVYRFYDGPIDNPEDGPEGRLNAWPLDEVYIDYVEGNAASGIINDPENFPTLSKELLATANEQGGEKNISTGYHAIEFLLWGQDLNAEGPGDRPFSDYLPTGGTAEHQDRRGQYLQLVTELLVDDLESVEAAWKSDRDNYAADFRALDAKKALQRILQGMGSFSGAELSGERMFTAYNNRDQEDEHSCFSDNTKNDLLYGALALQEVYLGRYDDASGPGLDQLVSARDAELDQKLQKQLAASVKAVNAIPDPFDQALLDDDAGAKILTAVRALQAQTETIVEVATLLGIKVNLE